MGILDCLDKLGELFTLMKKHNVLSMEFGGVKVLLNDIVRGQAAPAAQPDNFAEETAAELAAYLSDSEVT